MQLALSLTPASISMLYLSVFGLIIVCLINSALMFLVVKDFELNTCMKGLLL